MSQIIAAQAVVGFLAVVGIVTLWFGPLRWITVDWSRNAMFEARDELFDEAAAGRLSFDDPNYRRVRDSINSLIRYAHTLSFVRLAIHARNFRKGGRRVGSSNPRVAAEAIVDPTARAVALRALRRVEMQMWLLIFFKSPVLSVIGLIWLFRPMTIVRWKSNPQNGRSLLGRLQPYTDLIEAEAATA